MAQVNKRRRLMIQRPQRRLGDVPELIHVIQLGLPSKDAARTCILSKSWLHAWSTNPAIRFSPSVDSLKKKNQRKYMSWIHRTLLRYHRDNLPITSLDLQFSIHDTTLRSAYKLIMQATSKTRSSLNELHLAIVLTTTFTLPDEILLSANLHTLSLIRISGYYSSLWFSTNPSIHCTNLRVLKLVDVHIDCFVLHDLLSTCKLLQKIHIELPVEFRIIRVSNLRYLDELTIFNPNDYDDIFEVDDVPSLRSLHYDTVPRLLFRPVVYKVGTIRILRELILGSVSMDDAFLSMIKSNFPFLESLTLMIICSSVEILDITSLTLRKLSLYFDLDNQIKVHVNVCAPNLLVYSHLTLEALPPSFLFSTIPPQKIDLGLLFDDSIDELFFLNIRETLKLSSKFKVTIVSKFGVYVPFDIDEVRTILPFPATNVEEMMLIKHFESELEEDSLLFDAAFSVCHPMYVKAKNNLNLKLANYLLNKLMVQENEIGEVSCCEIRNPLNGRWVALTSSSLSLLDTTTLRDCTDPDELTEFKLSWCSP